MPSSCESSTNAQYIKPNKVIRKPRMRVKAKPYSFVLTKSLGLSDFISNNMHLYGEGDFFVRD